MTRGSSLRVPSFTIDLSTGEASAISPEIGLDVYPLWLAAAITHARMTEVAAHKLDQIWNGQGGSEIEKYMEREIVAAMSCIVACAAAIDAFYGSVCDRTKSGTPSTEYRRRRRARERIILATFQQKFALSNGIVSNIKRTMQDIFRFRHIALHAHGRPEQSVLHPRLQVGMSRKHVIFRAENAVVATTFALNVVAWLTTRAHSRNVELRKHCEYAREWLQPLVDDWETDHAALDLPRPLAEQVKQ